jgi:signal transduction histidine kinase
MSTTTLNAQGRNKRKPLLLQTTDTNDRTPQGKIIAPKRSLRTVLPSAIRLVKDFWIKYPAVLSGYIIYSYLFITIMRFFLRAKSRELTLYEIYEIFDALPFMWVLAAGLVKVIHMRTKLHNSEKERIVGLQELEIKQTQLDTLHEVARGFQHRVNNPLAIISLTLGTAKRAALDNPVILEHIIGIEDATNRIKQAVIDFSRAEKYDVEYVGNVLGFMANPASSVLSAPPRD